MARANFYVNMITFNSNLRIRRHFICDGIRPRVSSLRVQKNKQKNALDFALHAIPHLDLVLPNKYFKDALGENFFFAS